MKTHPPTLPVRDKLITLAVFVLILSLLPARALAHPNSRFEPRLQPCFRLVSDLSRSTGNQAQFLFGVINDQSQHYNDEWARGVRATTFELQWRRYEPRPGEYDLAYISSMRSLLSMLKLQGWTVQLIPGYHYAPEWILEQHPDWAFVNQYGDRYTPSPETYHGYQVINAPFNPEARAAIAGYLKRIFQDFDQHNPLQQFDSVRIGGGVHGELRYPPPDWNDSQQSFWAFDRYAQNPEISGIPASAAGWRPGLDPNPGSQGIRQWLINPGFEASWPGFDLPGWSPDAEAQTDLTGTEAHSGQAALRLALDSPHRVHQYVPVAGNTEYNLSGWLQVLEGNGAARLFATQYGADHLPLPGVPFVKLESSAGDWSQREHTLVTAPEAVFLKVELDGSQPGVYAFDDLSLNQSGDDLGGQRQIDTPLSFYNWYVDSLSDYQNWQIEQIRQHYSGTLDLVYPGKGLLTVPLMDALTNDLNGDGWSEGGTALYSATYFPRHLQALPPDNLLRVYLTGIDQPPPGQVDDTSTNPDTWSAAHWLSTLAAQHELPIWGENRGQNDRAELWLSASRMRAYGFLGLMWGFESELYQNTDFAHINDYTGVIAVFNSAAQAYLPLCYSP